MAIVWQAGNSIRCLSTDAKPATFDGWTLKETDTGKSFIRVGGSWIETGGGTGSHPDLSAHDVMGLATDTELGNHVSAADPHTVYQKISEKGNANGYAGLDGSGTVPDAQIPATIARDTELHTQDTDQWLDMGGGNAVTAAQTKTAYSHSQVAHAPSDAQKNSDILKSEIEAKLTGEIATHSHAGGGGPAFPIGSVFLAVVNTNPATLLGYGTWTQIAQGQFLVGQKATDADFDVAEKTGGAKSHVLTVAEMPPHSHILRRHATSTGSLTGITTSPDTSSSNPADAGPESGIVGGGTAHNNLPPYLVVYVWKRMA